MGRHEAVWSNSNCKIDLVDMPDRFQALPGVESGFQDRLMNRFEVLIVWSEHGFFTKWVQNRPFDVKICPGAAKYRARPRQIDQKIS